MKLGSFEDLGLDLRHGDFVVKIESRKVSNVCFNFELLILGSRCFSASVWHFAQNMMSSWVTSGLCKTEKILCLGLIVVVCFISICGCFCVSDTGRTFLLRELTLETNTMGGSSQQHHRLVEKTTPSSTSYLFVYLCQIIVVQEENPQLGQSVERSFLQFNQLISFQADSSEVVQVNKAVVLDRCKQIVPEKSCCQVNRCS